MQQSQQLKSQAKPQTIREARLAHIDEVLEAVSEYMDQRADAEYSTESPAPVVNEEMRLFIQVEDARRTLEQLTRVERSSDA